MTPEQKTAVKALAQAIDLFLAGGINRASDLAPLLRKCEELDVDAEELREYIKASL
jgi:aspartyl/asparaginyl-tRNA synthetase